MNPLPQLSAGSAKRFFDSIYHERGYEVWVASERALAVAAGCE